ncbi:MAG: 6-phosphogluconolactonase [Bacteroidetes bacterium]|nr:6-phosphogluconolactonase [Bacteroidota bacterium]
MNPKEIVVLPTIEKLADFIETLLCEKIAETKDDEFLSVALSGGSTPKKIFEHISSHDTGLVNWNKVRFFWGDERCVPPDDNESNYKMARLSLFENLNIPKENIFRIFGENEPENEVIRYGKIISENILVEDKLPRFDLIILGLGEDGHTASIFPGNIKMFYSTNYCEVAIHPQSSQKRITLTGTVINNAKKILFMVTGSGKAEMVTNIIQGNEETGFPASLVKPTNGKLTWLLDVDAARLLDKNFK